MSTPVWFAKREDTIDLLPVGGSHSQWYKNVLENPTVGLEARGTRWEAKATPIIDSSKLNDVFASFRGKYGADQVKQYYGDTDLAVEIPLT